MKICPKCKAENRPEAAFCSNCGTILLSQAIPPKPFETESIRSETRVPEPEFQEPPEENSFSQNDAAYPATIEQPAPPPSASLPETEPWKPEELSASKPSFTARKDGAVFGERFLYQSLAYDDEHENLYTVAEICQMPDPCIRVCSNPGCRMVHIPSGTEQEKYCTNCGNPLDETNPILILQEADTDRFGNQDPLIQLNLAHPNVHPPISVFQETVDSETRYCMVTPYSLEVPSSPEISQVLEWGLQLASGLDYLQSYGVAFGTELDSSNFGLVGEQVVWRNFTSARVLPVLADREKINNVRMLALSLYSWITGKSTYITDTSLHPRLNRLFYRALEGEGFTSGKELAEQIRETIKGGLSTFNLVYQTGQRSHPGQKRSNNEDSLLCLTLSSVQQGISFPTGMYAIADGMGGHASGDLASSLAIQLITKKASSGLLELQNEADEEISLWLVNAIMAANKVIYETRQAANTDMGSTLTCVLMSGDRVCIGNVGDSRVYLLRGGEIRQLTTDHSVVQQLVSMGKLTPEEARDHPQRNMIYRSLGENLQVEVDICMEKAQPGDMLLLCSDGLNSELDDQRIQILTRESTSPQVACDYLVDAANLAGGDDNISVIVINVISA